MAVNPMMEKETASDPLKSLLLSEAETMALLDMCLTSSDENDPAKERAMMKLTLLVRRFLAEDEARKNELPLACEIYNADCDSVYGQAWTSSLTGLVAALVGSGPRP